MKGFDLQNLSGLNYLCGSILCLHWRKYKTLSSAYYKRSAPCQVFSRQARDGGIIEVHLEIWALGKSSPQKLT